MNYVNILTQFKLQTKQNVELQSNLFKKTNLGERQKRPS